MHLQRSELATFAEDDCTHDGVRRLKASLRAHGTLMFQRMESGLFPASPAGESVAFSGYENVWVRDNVWVAYGHLIAGDAPAAVGVAQALLSFFQRHHHRFDGIIDGTVDPDDVGKRPHVRFNGRDLTEVAGQRWAHAQNDALGYFVWLFAQLIARGYLPLDDSTRAMLTLFVRYFAAIEYWQDEDSGHWEEQRKISASSIGVVVAGLEQLLVIGAPETRLIEEMVAQGRAALETILPFECAQVDAQRLRRYDAALLFLVHPLGVVGGDMAAQIVFDVTTHLIGEVGIRRYPGDSYWAPNYDAHLGAADRTRDFSDDIVSRNKLLQRIGDEAQWCLFDPILSAYFAKRGDRSLQLHYLRRTLAQITDSWQCPELYYWKDGCLTPGPHTPLQWTQANLLLALDGLNTLVD